MPLKLITETRHDIRTLVETKEPGKSHYFIEGIFMEGDIKNQNGRIYPSDILEREVERYKEEYINQSRAFGELGHPASPTINLERTSHMIKELRREGKQFYGKAKITQGTPYGSIVASLIDEGAKLGVSSRGVGSLRETTTGMQVGNDFYFSTVDIVAEPSAPNAFVQGIMEGREWVWSNGILREADVANLHDQVDAAHGPNVSSDEKNRLITEAFESFLTNIGKGVRSKIIIR